MLHRRLYLSEIPIGQPLPWDVHDPNGQLLLRKGYVIEHPRQARTLAERGMLIEEPPTPNEHSVPKEQETPSVLRLVNRANKRLHRLLFDLHEEPDFPCKVREVARLVEFALEVNPDIAIACILLNQQSGPYPIRHCIDTAAISILIARSMKVAPETTITLAAAALTMNVGMIQHHAQLERKPYALPRETLARVRQHPEEGVRILQSKGVSNPDWLAYVLSHHETEDGTGYPLGKTGQDIPLPAKIISLADRYCACVSSRDFRKSTLPNVALRDIFLESGKSIDSLIAAHFIKEMGIYPPGTFVRLDSGEIGVVFKKGGAAATPWVKSLTGPLGAPLAFPIQRDTSQPQFAIKETLRENQTGVHFSMDQVWGDEARL